MYGLSLRYLSDHIQPVADSNLRSPIIVLAACDLTNTAYRRH